MSLSTVIRLLNQDYELFLEKLSRLRRAYIFETDPAQKFKLEHEIEELHREKNRIETELARMEDKREQLQSLIHEYQREQRTLLKDLEQLLLR